MIIEFAFAIAIRKAILDACKTTSILATRHASSLYYVAANRNAAAALRLAASNHHASEARRHALMNRPAIENNREKQQ